MQHIDISREIEIRLECRNQHKETGSLRNPYEKGTIPALVFEDEALKIKFKGDLAS